MTNLKQKLKDIEFYQKKALTLVDKSGSVRKFAPNIYQRALNNIVADRSKPTRLLILKCRQVGASTWGSSFTYHRTATQFNKSALVIADNSGNSAGIFNMLKGFYERSPETVRPQRRYSNQTAIVFNTPKENDGVGLNSQILVSTSGNLSAGRSKTIQYLHCSEYAFWEDAATVSTGLFQSVPFLENTAIIIESTANGVSGKGEQFYNLCMRALDGDSAYSFCFFDWKDNPEYEIIPPKGFKRTPEEEELAAKYPNLTDAKIMFRRYKIENELGTALMDPVDQWNQEYPDSPEIAFISSGRPVFSAELIHSLIKKAKQFTGTKHRLDAISPVEDKKGEIVIYDRPKQGMAYAIGADVAEGIEGGDFSTFCVLDKELNMVATYCGHVDPDKFGRMLVLTGKYYNNAILAPESNNHGYAVIAAIKNLNYNRVFKREEREELGKDITDKIGWHTNIKTKMLMLDELVAAVRDGSVTIKCESTLREMLSLVIEPDGNVVLNSKDKTVSLAISLQAIKQAVMDGQFKAIVPGAKNSRKDVTKMTIEEKMKYYSKISKT